MAQERPNAIQVRTTSMGSLDRRDPLVRDEIRSLQARLDGARAAVTGFRYEADSGRRIICL